MHKNLAHLALVLALAVAPAMAQSLFFPARNDFETGFTGAGSRLAVGDFDGDGELDAVVTLEIGVVLPGTPTLQESILVFRGDGHGLFEGPPTVLSLPVNSYPGDVVTGQFAGDASLDFAVAVEDLDGGACNPPGDPCDGGVLIFEGDGSFGFTLADALTGQGAGSGLTGLAVGELNGGGGDDLVLINSASDSFTVFLSPSYSGTTTSSGVCAGPVALALGNLNGSSQPDLVLACDQVSGADQVQIWLNQGLGTFTPAPGQPAPTGLGAPRAVAIADLNNDSFNDVAVASSSTNRVILLRNDGLGSFDEFASSGVPVGDGPGSVDADDVDGDGVQDLLLASTESHSVSVLHGSLDGSGFDAQPGYVETAFAAGRGVSDSAWADLNGDGTPDVVTASANEASGTLSSYLGGGDGLVFRAIRYSPGQISGQDVIDLPRALAAGDWNGDGADDFAVASVQGHSVSLFVATPAAPGPFTLLQQLTFGTSEDPSDVLAADMDGDGDQDLLILLSSDTGNGRVAVYVNDGSGLLTPDGGVTVGALPWAMVLADFNGDGEADLAVSNLLDHTASIYQGDPNGPGFTHAIPQNTLITTRNGTRVGCSTSDVSAPQDRDCLPTGLAAADFDGDGIMDLAVSDFGDVNSGSTVQIFRGNGAFGFTHQLELEVADPAAPLSSLSHKTLLAGDLDGNGREDLVAIGLTPDDYVSVWLNTSTSGSFVFTESTDTPFLLPALDAPSPDVPRNALLIDLNGDDLLDLAVTGASSNNVAVLLGAGDGTLDTGNLRTQAFGLTQAPSALVHGDFNGDGLDDLLAAGSEDNDLALLSSGFLYRCDLDGSGRVDGFDLALLSRLVVTSEGDPAYEFYLDIDMDGEIGVMDLPILALAFGTVF